MTIKPENTLYGEPTEYGRYRYEFDREDYPEFSFDPIYNWIDDPNNTDEAVGESVHTGSRWTAFYPDGTVMNTTWAFIADSGPVKKVD